MTLNRLKSMLRYELKMKAKYEAMGWQRLGTGADVLIESLQKAILEFNNKD